ncbi:MAG: ERF family protein [Actinobacteria bacterium]|nr:ERF family protein [Actinomycetota bacterium]
MPETPADAKLVELPNPPTNPLYSKLAKIMGELSAIPKDKLRHVEVKTATGGSYSYDYITEATLMEELRPKLAAAGIATFYSDEILRNPEGEDNLTVVRVSLTFADGETGEIWTCQSDGYGTDRGDKGANKAKTSALRYLLWKTFLFASDLDPETESVERRSGGSGGGASGKPASDKQKALVRRLLNEVADVGVTFGGDHPDEAVHRRTPVEDLSSPQASRLIDLLGSAKAASGDLDAGPLDGLIGGRLEGGGDFPPKSDDDIGY